MSAESRRWDCNVCKEPQESIDRPKLQICEDCLRPVAERLCHKALSVPLNTPGVDQEYWMHGADALVGPMFKRWRDAS